MAKSKRARSRKRLLVGGAGLRIVQFELEPSAEHEGHDAGVDSDECTGGSLRLSSSVRKENTPRPCCARGWLLSG